MQDSLKTQLDTMDRKEMEGLYHLMTILDPKLKDLNDDQLRELLQAYLCGGY